MIEHKPFGETRTWYVVFDWQRSKVWRWWHLFTRKEFAHCWLFSEVGNGVMIIDPQAWGIAARYEDKPIMEYAAEIVGHNITALVSITVDYRACTAEPVRRGFYSCVSTLKAVLGLRHGFYTITPFQFYRLLHKQRGFLNIKPYAPSYD